MKERFCNDNKAFTTILPHIYMCIATTLKFFLSVDASVLPLILTNSSEHVWGWPCLTYNTQPIPVSTEEERLYASCCVQLIWCSESKLHSHLSPIITYKCFINCLCKILQRLVVPYFKNTFFHISTETIIWVTASHFPRHSFWSTECWQTMGAEGLLK